MRARFLRNGTPFAIALCASLVSPLALSAYAETPDSLGISLSGEEDQNHLDGPHSLVGSYLAARMARESNDAAKASEFYLSALSHDPGSAVLLEQAFLMRATQGPSPETDKLAEELVAANPQNRIALLFLGLKNFRDGDYKLAEKHLKAASTGPIGELTGSMALAWVKLAENNARGAVAELEAPKQADWAQFYLRYHKALIEDIANRKGDALAAYGRVFKQDPKALRTTLAYVRSLSDAGRNKEASAVLAEHASKSQGESHVLVRQLAADIAAGTKTKKLIETPADGLAESFYGLGEALIGEGAVAAGILYMQMALSVAPEHEFALATLANAYEANKQYEDASAIYDKIPSTSAMFLPIQIHRAYNMNSLDRSDEALKVLNDLLTALDEKDKAPAQAAAPAKEETSEPARQTATKGSPLALGASGDVVRALQNELRKLGFNSVAADGIYGETTRRAVQAFQRKNKLEADGMAGGETLALLGIGGAPSAPVAQKETPEPTASTVAKASMSDRLQILDALGSIQNARKLHDKAIETYTQALALIPKIEKRHWSYFYARGTSYERVKNWPAAEADLKKALELAPGEPLILNYLAYSWIDKGVNLKEGMALIEKAVALKPDDGFIVDSLGWAHFRLGNYREAVRYLERAVELRPEDPILNDHLGDALWQVGREREARFQWDQALSLNPEPEDAERIKTKIADGLKAAPPVRAGSLQPDAGSAAQPSEPAAPVVQ